MFLQSEHEKINTEFKRLQKVKSEKATRIFAIILITYISILVILFLIVPNIFMTQPGITIFSVYGGLLFVSLVLGLLLSKYGTSEKPSYEYLYGEIIKKIEQEEDLVLTYIPYDKEKHTFNKEGGLFTSFASVKVRRHISGMTKDNNKFQIYDAIMSTSNGKSQQVHFDGIYFIIPTDTNSYLQVRSHSSPKLKGIKFKREKEFEDIRVFTKEEETLLNNDHQYIQYVRKIKAYPEIKKVALAVCPGEVHLALWYVTHPAKKQKVITYEKLNQLYKYFMDELSIVDEVKNINNF